MIEILNSMRKWFALPAVFSLFALYYLSDRNPLWLSYIGCLAFLGFLLEHKQETSQAAV